MKNGKTKEKVFYFCDATNNQNCKKDYCKLFGGECKSTIYADEALHDESGKPIVNKEFTDFYNKTFLGKSHEQEKS